MHGFKSAILAKMKNCQNGTFEPVHVIQKFFLAKSILLALVTTFGMSFLQVWMIFSVEWLKFLFMY